MARSHQIEINGRSFQGTHGALLLDEALRNGIDLSYDCRAGHCGTCCVRLVSGEVLGGQGSEPGIVHACRCRIAADAVIEKRHAGAARSVHGKLLSLRALSSDVMEVGIETERALPFHAGQYARVQFKGYPSRPFSMTHPLTTGADPRSVWFHMRRMMNGRVTPALGNGIRRGHQVTLTGPFGSAHFRSDPDARIVLVATNTGFAPIWSIAVAALRENPDRMMMIIVGGRTMEALYMWPALARLARFPNVLVVPFCSSPQMATNAVKRGRPTDYLPRLLPTDVLYACGAPGMVAAVKSTAVRFGAVCHADPFGANRDDRDVEKSIASRFSIAWPNAWRRAGPPSISAVSGGNGRARKFEWMRQE